MGKATWQRGRGAGPALDHRPPARLETLRAAGSAIRAVAVRRPALAVRTGSETPSVDQRAQFYEPRDLAYMCP